MIDFTNDVSADVADLATHERLHAAAGLIRYSERPRKCPTCKKKFHPTPEWGYKRNDRCFCSWTCVRAWDREHERK